MATRDALGAALAALDGRRAEAPPRFEAAHRRLLELHLPVDAARVAITAAHVLGVDDATAARLLGESRDFAVSVEAVVLVDMIDGLAGTAPDREGAPRGRRMAPAGDTELVAEP
jgi:hypothetical protein